MNPGKTDEKVAAEADGPLSWGAGGVPVSRRFDDPYYSLENGLAETRHVFLAGNGLPDRFRDRFQVAELGFGTGLNLLATLQCWRETGQKGVLRYTSFEAFPMAAEDMLKALSAFPGLEGPKRELSPYWRTGCTSIALTDLEFNLVIGDARQTLPAWDGVADAWYLDGFSPAKNPELWEAGLLAEVGAHTAPGGTAATYTAAGAVRQNIAAAGFQVERVPGFGRKRHMTRAVRETA